MTDIGWRPIGPCDPRPLECLEHNGVPGADGGQARPGYSLAEASIIFFKTAEINSAELRVLQRRFSMWGRRGAERLYRPISCASVLEIETNADSDLLNKSDGNHWQDVRFIPKIYAPNIHEFLDGITLRKAFEHLVLFDHETEFAANAASKAAPCFRRIVAGGHFGPDNLLKIDQLSWLNHYCSRYLNAACSKAMETKVQLGVYPELVARKTQALLRLLAEGRILSDGFYRSDRLERRQIDSTLWRRSEYAIDLKKSDLVNVERGESDWNSIILRAPKFDVADEPTPPIADAGQTLTKDDLRAIITESREAKGGDLTSREMDALWNKKCAGKCAGLRREDFRTIAVSIQGIKKQGRPKKSENAPENF